MVVVTGCVPGLLTFTRIRYGIALLLFLRNGLPLGVDAQDTIPREIEQVVLPALRRYLGQSPGFGRQKRDLAIRLLPLQCERHQQFDRADAVSARVLRVNRPRAVKE